jgi:hypothetical protein
VKGKDPPTTEGVLVKGKDPPTTEGVLVKGKDPPKTEGVLVKGKDPRVLTLRYYSLCFWWVLTLR